MLVRALLEQREREMLAPYAMKSGDSRGRVVPEDEHPYRTAYQKDRDRIIHTTAFRRLAYKTQVFVYYEGDHYRTRLTHTIEVAQIGRTMARALGANEDLVESICLAHDLGHPPFGHTGEAVLNECMREHGGFDHQRQTMRIVEKLERRFPDFPGLNLTYEVREGLVKHDTDYDVACAAGYEPEKAGTLECQIANLADEIAYSTSDLDDGLRAGLLDPGEVQKLAIWRDVMRSLGEPLDRPIDTLLRHRAIRRLVGMEVTAALEETTRRLRESGVQSVEELRALGRNVVGFSAEMEEKNQELRQFLMTHFYRHYRVMRMTQKARRLITDLFWAYIGEPTQLPQETLARAAEEPEGIYRVVCDYIAGMTDRYALDEHRKLFDPEVRA
ncbi:MAG: deoxyguanosinetriphosphate triphosphohydrolase [Anaerolineae bacterium]|nr:deoxyguanosinetriphosphate triphosphohydrolase [Anaerolineae bacterium]MDW8098106.1 deoxyguanosinetriphosphate triphosphohydrolase [Anaerolineae bacterium]